MANALKIADSNEIKIDRGIPLAQPMRSGGRPSMYPWHEMEVGDSFLAPHLKTSNAHNVAMCASRKGKKFIARKTADGYRIWRTQ